MKVAHQNIPLADLPGLARGGGILPPPAPPAPAIASSDRLTPADRLAPVPVASAGNVRPQADRGLDGWFLDRLFGGR
jgi:penicillin-binding protein 1A